MIHSSTGLLGASRTPVPRSASMIASGLGSSLPGSSVSTMPPFAMKPSQARRASEPSCGAPVAKSLTPRPCPMSSVAAA